MQNEDIYVIANDHPVILFDGWCNLCCHTIQFISAQDKNHFFRFVPLQSKKSHTVAEVNPVPDKYDTVIALYKDKIYRKSDVTFLILKHLGGWWILLRPFGLLPRFIRDSVYDLIARYRYSLFGKRQKCFIPSEEEKAHFL